MPILQSATYPFWLQSINIHDAHTLQSVSRQWKENATSGRGVELFFGSINLHCLNLANPHLFDDHALLRTVQLAGPYLRDLSLNGFPSLILPRRGAFVLQMKQNNKIAKCSILNCRSIRLWDQIAWLKNQKQLLKLSMDGCMCGIVELKSLKKQLPSKCVLDLVQCEESGCTNVCGDTTCHCTGNDDDVFHLQNGVGNNNKKLCSEHMKTFQCSNCCVYFCGVQDNNGVFPVGCKECGKLLCHDCNSTNEERFEGCHIQTTWECDDKFGCCDENRQNGNAYDNYTVAGLFAPGICSSCAVKCDNCDANMCKESEGDWDWNRFGREEACNTLKRCQYCEKTSCNNCRYAGKKFRFHEDRYAVGKCSGTEDCGCDGFTCADCMDEMFNCDECGMEFCKLCIDYQAAFPGICSGCNKNLCGRYENGGRHNFAFTTIPSNACLLDCCCKCKEIFCMDCQSEWETQRNEGADDVCCSDCIKK